MNGTFRTLILGFFFVLIFLMRNFDAKFCFCFSAPKMDSGLSKFVDNGKRDNNDDDDDDYMSDKFVVENKDSR